MNLPGLHGQGQQVPVPDENFFKAGSVAYNDILRAEHGARKMAAIWSTEHFDQVFMALDITHQLLNQLNGFHLPPERRVNR